MRLPEFIAKNAFVFVVGSAVVIGGGAFMLSGGRNTAPDASDSATFRESLRTPVGVKDDPAMERKNQHAEQSNREHTPPPGDMPAVEEWDSHNLLFGEHFIPIAEAFLTPFATYYRIEKTEYIPVIPMGPIDVDDPCQKRWYTITPEMKGGATATTPAVAGAQVHVTYEGGPTGRYAVSASPKAVTVGLDCPRDLGNRLAAGSYVFDADGNDLAGVGFKYETHAYEIRDHLGRFYIMLPEGGSSGIKGPNNDPAITKMKLEALLVDARAYPPDHDHDEATNEIRELIPGTTGMSVDIEYLPAGSDNDSKEEVDVAVLAAVQREIDDLAARLDKVGPKVRPDKNPADILIVYRSLRGLGDKGEPSETEEQKERKEKGECEKGTDVVFEIDSKDEDAFAPPQGYKLRVMTYSNNSLPANTTPADCALNNSIALYSGAR